MAQWVSNDLARRERFHAVQYPRDGEDVIKFINDRMNEVDHWCDENLQGEICCLIRGEESYYFFEIANEAMLFKLRWL